MRQIALFSLMVACATPKTDTATSDDGTYATSDGGTSDGGTSDGGSSDGGTSDGGTSDGGSSDGGTSDGGSSNGGTSDGGTSGDGGSSDDGGDEGSSEGGEDSSSGTDGGSSGGDCSTDFLNFSASISDSDGPCSSPCDADDVLTYHLVIENTSLSDCVLVSSTTCLIEDVQIDVDVVHDVPPAETYYPSCGEAVTEHIIPAGGSVEDSLEGGVLGAGNYIAIINTPMDSVLASGTKAFTVE